MCQQLLKIHHQDLKELSHRYIIFSKYWHLREITENLKLASIRTTVMMCIFAYFHNVMMCIFAYFQAAQDIINKQKDGKV